MSLTHWLDAHKIRYRRGTRKPLEVVLHDVLWRIPLAHVPKPAPSPLSRTGRLTAQQSSKYAAQHSDAFNTAMRLMHDVELAALHEGCWTAFELQHLPYKLVSHWLPWDTLEAWLRAQPALQSAAALAALDQFWRQVPRRPTDEGDTYPKTKRPRLEPLSVTSATTAARRLEETLFGSTTEIEAYQV